MDLISQYLMSTLTLILCGVAIIVALKELYILGRNYYNNIYISNCSEHSIQHMGILTLAISAIVMAIGFSIYYNITMYTEVWVLYGLMAACVLTMSSHLKEERESAN